METKPSSLILTALAFRPTLPFEGVSTGSKKPRSISSAADKEIVFQLSSVFPSISRLVVMPWAMAYCKIADKFAFRMSPT